MHITSSNQTSAQLQLANSFLTSQRLEYRAAHQKRGMQAAAACTNQDERTKGAASRFIRGCGGVALALLVGTGGIATPHYVTTRDDKGYRLLDIKYSERKIHADAQRAKLRSSAENLAFVRNTLKPPVTELASFFGVSRQAIYNWQAGDPISTHNETLLQQLADATTLLHREGLTGSGSLIKRRLPGGKTLLEQMQGGESGESAAKALIAMLQAEARQRSGITHRLKGRAVATSIDPSDAGTPHLDEQA
ncbi:Cro/Cl family transcriptional regulator [Pseudomonas sp. EggHat1]|uniref:Cro/Cl family transcriptional regulator n=1 Tax=Pseudomonas sp. EggHat1 TaxID=2761624 RepID=UPI0018696DD1|nr:Cro/Cl family transcriptional regulator [Pseudomonas sp. EggHat1]